MNTEHDMHGATLWLLLWQQLGQRNECKGSLLSGSYNVLQEQIFSMTKYVKIVLKLVLGNVPPVALHYLKASNTL